MEQFLDQLFAAKLEVCTHLGQDGREHTKSQGVNGGESSDGAPVLVSGESKMASGLAGN